MDHLSKWMKMTMQSFTTSDGVTVQPFGAHLHRPGSISATGGCAQGGLDTCDSQALFSITSDRYKISACAKHLYGALHLATQEQLKAR